MNTQLAETLLNTLFTHKTLVYVEGLGALQTGCNMSPEKNSVPKAENSFKVPSKVF